jgi:uncharacterized protein (TIGR00299 family) protein
MLLCKGFVRTAYLDAFSGLSGDMLVGALLDCGADFAELVRILETLEIGGYAVSARRKLMGSISALKFEVEVLEPQPERRREQILGAIASSRLSPRLRDRTRIVFELLAQAEAKVHAVEPAQVHFHEVGAVDSIIDVVSAAWCIDTLGIENLLVSPLPLGSGLLRSGHGILPLPAPAAIELLSGFPVRPGDGEGELVTPTGAALVRAFAGEGKVPEGFRLERVGYGAGSRELSDRPNVLRVLLGETAETDAGIDAQFETDEMVEITANIDDLSPQIYDYVVERLFAAGARDVTVTPTVMKKGRPGVILSVLAEPASRAALTALLFAETSTIGVRFHKAARVKLKRRMIKVETRWGTVSVKISGIDGAGPLTISPEYDDCRRVALEHGVALKLVLEEAQALARRST